MIGCSDVSGRSPTMRLTLSRTSCAATSAFFSRRNVMKTCETPSTEVERNSSMPLMVLTAASTLSVTSVSISRGLAPGLTTVTVMVGRSIFGKRSTPNVVTEKSPTTVSDRINIVANTGRRTQISANFCMSQAPLVKTIGVNSLCALCDYFASFAVKKDLLNHKGRKVVAKSAKVLTPKASLSYRNSVSQLIHVRGGDEFVGGEVAFNLDEAAVRLARCDESLVRDAVLDDEDARGRAVGLDGG